MSDEAAAAPAATDSAPASAPDAVVSTPQPIDSRGPERAKEPERAKAPEKIDNRAPDKKTPSISEAIKNADKAAKEKAAKATADKKPDANAKPAAEPKGGQQPAKTEAKPAEQARGEGGRFAPKDGGTPPSADADKTASEAGAKPASAYSEPPSRFRSDPQATEAWSRAEEPLRGAVHRVVKELEGGIEKLKPDAQSWSELKPFTDLATKHGTSVKAALNNYVNAELEIRRDPIGGLEKLVANLGIKGKDGQQITFRDLAAFYLGQKPDAVASRNDAARQAADQRTAQIERKLDGLLQHIQDEQQSRQMQGLVSMIDELAAKHPRMEELADDIQLFLQSGKIRRDISDQERLSEAYKLAERLNPASGPASNARAQTPDDAEAQTLDRGRKSITGAPSSGSDPEVRRKPSSSIRESLERAARAAT